MKRLLIFFTILWFLPFVFSVNPFLLNGHSRSKVIYDQAGTLLRLTLSEDDKYRMWTPLDKIPAVITDSYLLKEDRAFFYHPGFNPISIVSSLFDTYILRQKKRGGSTISMQVARLHYKLQTKSIAGKLQQILLAYVLELTHTKSQIFEAYLNLTPYGRNIEGIATAAQIYFRKNLHELHLSEVLTLVSLPQNPTQMDHHKNFSQIPKSLQQAKEKLFNQWQKKFKPEKSQKEMMTMSTWAYGLDDLPFLAPHLTDYLLRKYPNNDNIKAKLDFKIQQVVEQTLKSYIDENRVHGLENAVAMVINTKNMEVVSLVGSADYFNQGISGQVNGALALRSPGSTLKPFVYALAMGEGIIHTQSILYDAPLEFKTPENFDSKYKGPITAENALITSRNVPAVFLSSRLKQTNLYSLLKASGIAGMKLWGHYGDGLVLGGMDLSMAELGFLYGALRNGGVVKSLKWIENDPDTSKQILEPESVAMVMDILAKNPRPNFVTNESFIQETEPVYWKTGTSIGFRDAWSIGIFRNYVIATWVGNFSGKAHPLFIGGKAAAPLFFRIVDLMKSFSNSRDSYYPMLLGNLESIHVCVISGDFTTELCPHKIEALYRPGISPTKKCDIHRMISIDVKSGHRTCHGFMGKSRQELFEVWPTHILSLFADIGLARNSPPAYHKSCLIGQKSQQGDAPRILSPKIGLTYTMRMNDDRNQIKFEAQSDSDVKELFWYVNDSFVGKTKSSDHLFWDARPGHYTVKLVDDRGRRSLRQLEVSLVQ